MAIKNKKKIKLDKKDFLRALLTDTAPSDVPVIFSNEGFYTNAQVTRKRNGNSDTLSILDELYINVIECQLSENAKVSDKQFHESFPLKYKIMKDHESLRTLSLIHPRAQIDNS